MRRAIEELVFFSGMGAFVVRVMIAAASVFG